jgi:hypothetical protein
VRIEKRNGSEVETAPKKVGGVKRWRGASSRAGDKTSERELLLAKALKLSKKSVAAGTEAPPSGLSDHEKAWAAKVSSRPPRLL